MNSLDSGMPPQSENPTPLFSLKDAAAEKILTLREKLETQIEIKPTRRFIMLFPELNSRYEGVLPGQDEIDFYMEGYQAYSHVPIFEFGAFCLGSGLQFAVPVQESHEEMIQHIRDELIQRLVDCAESKGYRRAS